MRHRQMAFGFLLGLVTAGTTVAIAAIPDSNTNVISGCYTTKNGALRVIDFQAGRRCASGEVLLQWNQQGLQGPAGPPGPQGPSGSTTNCIGYPRKGVDWSNCDLRGANLSGMALSNANLQGASLQNARLRGANLDGANLTGANLLGADLNGVSRVGTIWSATVCPNGTTSEQTPGCRVPELIAESFSKLIVRLSQSNSVSWTGTFFDSSGRLPEIMGARLCPPGSISAETPGCTGATMSRLGTASQASYTGVFGIGSGWPLGEWSVFYFWPVGQASTDSGQGSIKVSITQ